MTHETWSLSLKYYRNMYKNDAEAMYTLVVLISTVPNRSNKVNSVNIT